MKLLRAGDMSTADGGVGGIGDISFLAAVAVASSGITRGVSDLRISIDALDVLLKLRELR
jgi:hypothetical protein